MTDQTAPPAPDDDELTGPAAAHARRYGKPAPIDPNLTGPAAAHARRFPRKETR